MDPVAIDTDVASLLIKRKLPTDMARLLAGRPLVLTFVTLGELHRWVEQRQWGTTPPRDAEPLAHRQTHPAQQPRRSPHLGIITAYASLRGRPRPANDSWIAASCLAYGVALATCNVKDYEDFVAHEGLILVGNY